MLAGGIMEQTKSEIGGRLVCSQNKKYDNLLNIN